ncbi:putative Siderophore biosynthesis protein SbnE [Nitrospina gracilis 3/211]|uniref:Putative Siderophore biosynthesis protein SbnE n=1 Tax=Nitrospina gracilis (strain 3/211) TaxID=1266370 RepID=M1YYD3_NITG3|nr:MULTISPECIES: IucA/IucC family protein [Nitrospina]MCF8723603.1 siderophore synthetase component [Nitrospina sp. Nb-3]CCQ90683.1 putative Siderophore biosynthesis protein SbnE [Nitrospina gracilis 3/211]
MKTQVDNTARHLAERAATERLLNCYLRETGILEPPFEPDASKLDDACRERVHHLEKRGQVMVLRLAAMDAVLMGVCRYRSVVGHHEYEAEWWCRHGGEAPRPIAGVMELGRLLMAELAGENQEALVDSLLGYVQNSLEKTTRYIEMRLRNGPTDWDPNVSDPLLTSERSLLFGHPFHPTPKSSEGFSTQDLARYSPELGATFRLHYFAVDPALIQEDFFPDADQVVIPEPVREEAARRLEARFQDWPLLPCHPWQYEYLFREQAVRDLLADGRVHDLGMLGNEVYPTSSVRTVLDPRHDYFFKLPFNVRLTNFVRVNPLEQMQRSVAASRALSIWAQHKPFHCFSVLTEFGYRTLFNPEWDSDTCERMAASFAVLFRAAPSGLPSPMVLAGLLEPDIQGGQPAIMQCIDRAARDRSRTVDTKFLGEWLGRYVEISLLPLLQCFVQAGISLEAHVQNSLVAVRAGWPDRFFVRDLEGASIARGIAARHGLFHHLEADSAAFYDDSEAWHRFKYYILVNHFGHLISTLARHGEADEQGLWNVVRATLQDNLNLFSEKGEADYIHDLLTSKTLPGKANFISRLRERGERPLYVPVPNPLQES